MENANNPAEVAAFAAREQRVKRIKRVLKLLWGFYVLGMALVVGIFFYLSFDLPSFEELENPESRIASNIYSSDGEILGKYYIENRTPVVYDSLSPYLVQALIATEDARYLEHSGIDAEAIGRVIVKTLLLGQDNAGGGSTISQQLAKLLVGRPKTKDKSSVERTWLLVSTKLKEWLTAVKLERSYTKEEIIALYFNEFDFLYGANGIKSAADIYFKKQPHDLSVNEAAMLVRMLKNPSLYNPKRYAERALKGREQVLKNMKEKGHLTEEEYHKLRVIPVDMSTFSVKNHNDGLAPHFRMYLRDHLKALMIQLAKDDEQLRKADGSAFDIYRDGLRIYTTIDARVQRHAEAAAFSHLASHQKKLFKSWKDWNNPNPKVSSSSRNPWTYKSNKNTDGEMELRDKGLRRALWSTSRYKIMREKLMPFALKEKLRDIDIYRILRVEDYNKRPRKDAKGRRKVNGAVLLEKWARTGYAKSKDIESYKRILNGPDLLTLKKEHKALWDYMKKPVPMTVFAHNTEGQLDTLLSPFDSLRYHRMHLQTGMVAVDSKTGAVRAWVGGLNHKFYQFDHVNKKRAARQVGSTIKPFLYALTVDLKNYSPCYKVWDVPTTISKGEGQFGLLSDWTPKNAGGYSGDEITLTEALNRSLNSVSAYLMKELKGPEPFRNFLAEVGIDTSNRRVPTSAAICLGVSELSPFEMAGGYTVFANAGTYIEPVFIDRIEDKNGNLIYMGSVDQKSENVLSDQGAYVMNQMLQRIQRGRLRGVKSQYGGKTGTTNFHADGWFMGITPDLVVGTWVGCDDRFIRFRSISNGQGARMARPIFHNLLKNMEADSSLATDGVYSASSKFPVPETIQREMNCLKYNQFDPGQTNVREEANDMTNQNLYDEDFYE